MNIVNKGKGATRQRVIVALFTERAIGLGAGRMTEYEKEPRIGERRYERDAVQGLFVRPRGQATSPLSMNEPHHGSASTF